MRVWNSLTVPLLAGVPSENILQLGYFDSTLTAMRQNPEKEIKSTKIDTTDVDIFRRANTSSLAKQPQARLDLDQLSGQSQLSDRNVPAGYYRDAVSQY